MGTPTVTHHQQPPDPTSDPVPDRIVIHPVTSAEAATLTAAVQQLSRAVHSRSVGFLIALILIAAVGIAVTIFGYRSEHFVACQVQQNDQFRDAAKTERDAQRKLFAVLLNENSTPADRLKASQDYYTGLIAADQQRSSSTADAAQC